jgi:acetyl-CoA synthetase
VEDGKLHLTVSDSGWAKFGWGKIYGQWLAETAIFVYDHEKFVPAEMLESHLRAQGDHVLRAAHRIPLFHQGGLEANTTSRIMKWAATAGEPLNPEVFHKWLEGDRPQAVRGLRPDGARPCCWPTSSGSSPSPAPWASPRRCLTWTSSTKTGKPCKDGESGEIVVRTDKGVNPGHVHSAITATKS